MEQHPLSAAFPAMSALEFASLLNDIRNKGLIHPLIVLDGMVLDGWNRFRACEIARIEPRYIALGADVDPVAYVQSVNLERRHLDASQRAVAVTSCLAWARSGENQNVRGGEVAAPPATVAEMAKTAGVSERTLQQAKAALAAGLGDAVRDGLVTVERAAEIAKLPEAERQAAVNAPKPKRKRKPKLDSALDTDEVQILKATIEDQVAEIKELAQALDVANDALQVARVVIADQAKKIDNLKGQLHLANGKLKQATKPSNMKVA